MPPADETPRPDDTAVAVLKRWIDEGATPFAKEAPPSDFVSDEQLVAVLHEDLFSVPERDRKFIRYFITTHLANAHLSSDELQTWRDALAKLVNSLSWNKDVVPLHDVGTSGTVFRVDIRDYSWNDRLWLDVLSSYPYGVLQNSTNARDLLDAADGRLSYVRADWFIATASRPRSTTTCFNSRTPRETRGPAAHRRGRRRPEERVARAGFNGSAYCGTTGSSNATNRPTGVTGGATILPAIQVRIICFLALWGPVRAPLSRRPTGEKSSSTSPTGCTPSCWSMAKGGGWRRRRWPSSATRSAPTSPWRTAFPA